MMRRRKFIASGAVTSAALLAGCTGSDDENGGEEGENGEDENGEPDIEETFELPAGITEEEVNQREVLEGHEDLIVEESATATFYLEGDDPITTQEVVTDIDDERIHGRSESHILMEQWISESESYTRAEGPNRVAYSSPENTVTRDEAFRMDLVNAVLPSVEFDYVEVIEDDSGRGVVVIEGSELTGEQGEGIHWRAIDVPEEIEVTAHVTSDGLISYLEVDAVDEIGEIYATVELTNVGETTVEEPEWLDEASELAVTFDIDETDTYLELTMVNGEAIPEESDVVVSSQSVGHTHERLEEPIEEGDTIYVAGTDEGMTFQINEEPTEGSIEGGETIEMLEQGLPRYRYFHEITPTTVQ